MVVDMELEHAKQAVFQLMKEKEKIEKDLSDANAILECNHVGMSDSLVDSEGYPRSDIDVFQIRHARHKIICLQNDHKNIMKNIEEGLHRVHALSGKNLQETDAGAAAAAPCSIEEPVYSEPFLRVNIVIPGSPAELAGIHVDDLILEFGSINVQNFKSLKDIGSLVENSMNKSIFVKVKRDGTFVVLTLTPRPWSGQGLLGCNVALLEIVER